MPSPSLLPFLLDAIALHLRGCAPLFLSLPRSSKIAAPPKPVCLFVWPTAGPLCPTDRSLPPSTVKPRRRKAGDAEYDQKECPWVVSSASCVCCLGGRKRGRLEGSREGGQSHVIKLNLILLFPTSPPSPPPESRSRLLSTEPRLRSRGTRPSRPIFRFSPRIDVGSLVLSHRQSILT